MKEETKNNSEIRREETKEFSNFLIDPTTVAEVELKEKTLTSPKQTFTTSRELARQQTRPKPIQGNLFDILNPKAKQRAIELSKESRLLSQITDGINGGVLASKVIIGLCQTLYTQSEMYDNTDRLLGISEKISQETGISIKHGEAGTRKKPDNKIISPYALIVIKTRDFARLVNGGKILGGKDVDAVKDTLQTLADKIIFIDRGDGRYIGMPLLAIKAYDIDTNTGKEKMVIELSPIFTRAIATDFVTIRKDALKVLAGNQKDITMRLFWYLIEMHSYKNMPTYPIVKISKTELYGRIAVLKQYEKRKKDREDHFKEAIEKMKALHLIKDYREVQGPGNDIIYFRLNKSYTSDLSETNSSPDTLKTPDNTESPDSPKSLFEINDTEIL